MRYMLIAAMLAAASTPAAQACPGHCYHSCQEELGRLGAAIFIGGASNPPIPGTTWGCSRSGRIVPVPIAAPCSFHRHGQCWR